MCDTILASPESTDQRIMIFGKNSDRERNEAQSVEFFSKASHDPGGQMKCTYITIPQTRLTHAVMICRPFWIWGAEMGANEHGVVVGNEGLQARSPSPQRPALIGMDLVRLALERASTAEEACEVITTLIETYGQGGNCGHLRPTYYNNAFMVADSTESYLVETVGREWLRSRVEGVQAISNAYTIGCEAQCTSERLDRMIAEAGWSVGVPTDYAEAIGDHQKQHVGQAYERRARSLKVLASRDGKLRTADFMSLLRDHVPFDTGETWSPRKAKRHGLCIHAASERQLAQTTGSLVSELRKSDSVHWVTATSAPCISIFKPVFLDSLPGEHRFNLLDRYDPDSIWWRHERMHRTAVMGDFDRFLREIGPERDALEATFREQIASVLDGGDRSDRRRIVARCWAEALHTEESWFARVGKQIIPDDEGYTAQWREMNRIAGLDIEPSE